MIGPSPYYPRYIGPGGTVRREADYAAQGTCNRSTRSTRAFRALEVYRHHEELYYVLRS